MPHAKLVDQQGQEAQITGITEDDNSLIVVHGEAQYAIPFRRVREEGDHILYLGSFVDLAPSSLDTFVVPVIQEEATIGKRQFATAKVRIKKSVHERVEQLSTELTRQSVRIERIPKDEVLFEAASPRVEDGVTIIPVQEEFYVLEKRYRLKEEVRIQTVSETRQHPIEVLLRSEEVAIDKEEL